MYFLLHVATASLNNVSIKQQLINSRGKITPLELINVR